jgi:hypothetical protein
LLLEPSKDLLEVNRHNYWLVTEPEFLDYFSVGNRDHTLSSKRIGRIYLSNKITFQEIIGKSLAMTEAL